MAVLKESLDTIISSRDGLYSLLFVTNCLEILKETENKECLDQIW